MANKFLILGRIIVALVSLCVVLFIVSPLFYWESGGESVFYIRVALLLGALHTFAVMRLYNALVQNTRFLIKMRDVTLQLKKAFPSLVRTMFDLGTSNKHLKNATDNLRRTMEENNNVQKRRRSVD